MIEWFVEWKEKAEDETKWRRAAEAVDDPALRTGYADREAAELARDRISAIDWARTAQVDVRVVKVTTEVVRG